VEVQHQAPRPDERLERQVLRALECHWLDQRSEGETVLVFLPGQRELLSCANEQTDALQMRLLEIQCDGLPRLEPELLARLDESRRTLLTPNRGCIGAVLARYCVAKGYDGMRSMGQAIVSDIFKELPNSMEGRFFVRAFAAAQMAHVVMDELGLWPFDWEVVREEAMKAFRAAMEYTENHSTSDPLATLRDMLVGLQPNVLCTSTDAGHIPSSPKDLVLNGNLVRMPLAGRYVRHGNYTVISQKAAQAWCATKSGGSLGQCLNDWSSMNLLFTVGGKTTMRFNLTRGLDAYAPQSTDVFIVDHTAINRLSGDTSEGVFTRPAAEVIPLQRSN
jgi:hypothetical protein